MNQHHLFGDMETAHARATDPQTSHEAAAKVDVPESHKIVLANLAKVYSATSEQVYMLCRMGGELITESRVRGALSELKDAGKIVVVHCNGVTASGNKCSVYKVKK